MYELTIFDLLSASLWILIIGIYSYFHYHYNIRERPYYKYYLYGLSAKMFGGICFALIYSFYYDYTGDTFVYYQDIQTLTDTFYSDPFVVLKILLNDAAIFDPDTHYITETLSFYRSNSAFYVVKIATPLNILAFNTYLGTTVLISYLSFLGVWKLFELFIKLKLQNHTFYFLLLFQFMLFLLIH